MESGVYVCKETPLETFIEDISEEKTTLDMETGSQKADVRIYEAATAAS